MWTIEKISDHYLVTLTEQDTTSRVIIQEWKEVILLLTNDFWQSHGSKYIEVELLTWVNKRTKDLDGHKKT